MFDVPDEAAIFAVPISDGPDLQAAASVQSADLLRIITHGAVSPDRDSYPHFEHVRASRHSGDAFVSFSDPTRLLSPRITLGWYTGASAWDPHWQMVAVVREALSVSGANDLVFIGGSGGGYAALRLSREFPGSVAYVSSPQTSLLRHEGDQLNNLLEAGYGGLRPDEAVSEYPGRFEVVSAYREGFQNRVYYLQNLRDANQIGSQYNPIRRAVGIRGAEGSDPTGRFVALLRDLEQDCNGFLAAAEFEYHFERALRVPNSSLYGASDDFYREVSAMRAEISALRSTVDELSDYSKRSHRAVMRELGIVPWSMESLSRVAADLIPNGRTIPAVGSYALRTGSVVELARTIRHERPSQVVECGSGSSTAWIALCLESVGHGHLTSLESGEKYARSTRQLLEELDVSHRVSLIEAPLTASELSGGALWYGIPEPGELPETIDLLLVDGPPSSAGPGIREPALRALDPRIAVDGLVLVDDADRPSERAMVQQWIEEFDLELDERTTSLVGLRRAARRCPKKMDSARNSTRKKAG